MSSNRANAAARQRRAGGADLNSNQPPQQKQQSSKQNLSMPKLSISDAIALITLRLGKVETIVSNYQNESLQVQVDAMGQPIQNAKMIDDSVFKSIVSRLDVLEKNQKVLMENQTSIANTVKTIASSKNGQTVVKDISEEKLSIIKEDIESLKTELRQNNDSIFNLQNMVQEASQKMVEISLTLNSDETEDLVEGTMIDSEQHEAADESVDEEPHEDTIVQLDLQEFIQNELNADE
jgi:hypothetical protein